MLEFQLPWDSQPQEAVSLNPAFEDSAVFNFSDGLTPPLLGSYFKARNGNWSLGPGASLDPSVAGKGVSCVGVGAGHRYDSTGHPGVATVAANSPFWMACEFEHRPFASIGSGVNVICSLDGFGVISAYVDSSNVLTVECRSTSLTGPALVAGRAYTIVWGRNAAGVCWLWINGALRTSGTGATTASTTTSQLKLSVAGDHGNTFRTYNGRVAGVGFGLLSPETFGADISGGFWRTLIAPQSIWVPVSAGGATAHDTTGALAGAGSTIAGSAAHIAIHGTSGALTGPGSNVVGSAARTRAHPTSGALTGPGSVVDGAAVHNTVHPTSGVLVGPGAEIDGAADHVVPGGTHDTSGALTGQGAVIAGSAAHVAVHGTSGVLVGAGAVLDGSAQRVAAAVTHDTSGVLAGQGAVISGTARGPEPDAIQPIGGGGWLPNLRRKTRKEIHAERVRLGILPEQIRKAAQKVAEKAAEQGDPEEVYEDNTEKYKAMFLREIGATKWAPDYARAIKIQLELMERDAEDALLLM
jgi:hypothetical protein